MLRTVALLVERLNSEGISYCHWKSNWALEQSLAGAADIDLLVDRGAADSFRTVLQDLGFRPAVEAGVAPFPSVQHFHALDEASGEIVHVHAYYRVISGDSLAKNYRFPLEEMLLRHVDRIGEVNVPSRAAELVVFVIRMSLKHASLLELALVRREWHKVRAEAAWLTSGDVRSDAARLVRTWLPGFDVALFEAALDALLAPAPLRRRILLGRRVRRELRPFARNGGLRAWWIGVSTLGGRVTMRLRGTRKKLAPASGGAVIAFVGAEASGKSTLLQAVERWLGPHYTVRRVHAGKPPSTALTVIPNAFLPLLRSLLPAQRSTTVSARLVADGEMSASTSPFPLLFGIRSVLLAHDRRHLLSRAFADSANGEIVLCDRYPSTNEGAVDGPQLRPGDPAALGSVRRRLAGIEDRLYTDIPPPDLVIQLTAPLEVTLERNRSRAKSEPDEYVLSRHARSSAAVFTRARLATVDTDRPLEAVQREVRRLIWEAL